MKKGTSFIYITVSILCLMLCTCKLSLEDTELFQKPDLDLSNRQVTLIIPKLNNSTDYINIYRKQSNNDDEVVGLIFPKDLPSGDSTYRFIDDLVVEGKKYKYQVRYHDNKGFQYSHWTDEIKIQNITNAYTESQELTYTVGSAKLTFSSEDTKLQVTGTITAPSDIPNFSTEYTPALIIKTSDKTQVFDVSQDFITGSDFVTLRGMLPLSFMDTPITIVGLIAQKKEYVDPNETDETKRVIKFIRWTSLTSININGHRDNTITVPSQSGAAGYDYSRSAQ